MREVIPGWAEAIAREKLLREMAFLPINDEICGIEIMPMTMRHVQFLTIGESPFAYSDPSREKIIASDFRMVHGWIEQFFWILSPHYRPGRSWKRIHLKLRLRKIDDITAVNAICDYLKETFWDTESDGLTPKSYYSWSVGIIGELAPKYGTDDELMDKPLRRLFQYIRFEARRKGIQITNRSDEVRRAYRAKKNQEELKRHAESGRN